MASTKLSIIAYDIQTDLKQVFTDREIQLSQVVYWSTIIGNRLLGQHIAKRDSGSFLYLFDGVQVLEDDNFFGRKYVQLPGSIFDFNKDKGVNYISFTSDGQPYCAPRFTRTTFTRTTPKASQRLYLSEYETPSPRNPYFYLSNKRIWFLGIEKVDVSILEMGLYLTLPPVDSVNINDDFEFPDELIEVLKRQVMDLGKSSLFLPRDRVNDGTSSTGPKDIVIPKQSRQAEQAETQSDI